MEFMTAAFVKVGIACTEIARPDTGLSLWQIARFLAHPHREGRPLHNRTALPRRDFRVPCTTSHDSERFFMPLTRVLQVDGRPIRIYDGLVAQPQVSQLTEAFLGANFVKDEVARPDTSQHRHWALNIPLETAAQLAVYQPTLAAVRDFEAGDTYRIYRCYCNHAAYGDMLFTHTDAQPGQKGLTALWYIAPEWNVEWGGKPCFTTPITMRKPSLRRNQAGWWSLIAPSSMWVAPLTGTVTRRATPSLSSWNRLRRDVSAPSRSCFAR